MLGEGGSRQIKKFNRVQALVANLVNINLWILRYKDKTIIQNAPPVFICARGVFVIHAYKRTSKLFAHPSDSFFQKKSPSPPHGFFKIQFIFLFFDQNMMPKARLKILVFGILFFSILVQKQKLHFSHYFWKKISLSKMPRHSKICLLVFFLILKKKSN